MEGKGVKMSEIDLETLERGHLEYAFYEAEDGGTKETQILMTPSLFALPTKKPPARLFPVEPMSLMKAHQRRDTSK